jgi:peptide/nickel transport system substrate-binding protein
MMIRRHREHAATPRASVLFAVICALAAPGCRGLPPDPTGLTIAIDSGPSSLDPRLGSDEGSRRFNDLVYNALFRTGDDARPVPDLALAATWTDPLTLVVHLRDGVLFHDGTPLLAADVVETYRSIIEGRVVSFRRADLEALESVDSPEPRVVRFHLSRPFVPFIANLTVPIARPRGGREAALGPLGTGPFRLARYRKDEDLLLERFDRYFEGPSALTSVRLRIIPAETSRMLELITGGVDLVVNDLAPDQFERLRRAGGFRVVSRPGRNVVYMAFNLDDPVLRDRRVRQAIAWSLDREAIVHHLLGGAAMLATGLLPPDNWAYNPRVTTYHPDAARAATLLAAAGVRAPGGPGPALRLEYKTTTSELSLQQAAIMQAQLAAAGIAIDIRAFEWPVFYDDLKSGRFQVAVSNWTDLGDPDVYRLRFHSGARPPQGLNRGGYANPEADRLIDEGARSTDDQVRRLDYARLQEILADDLPYVPLWHRHVSVALGPRVARFDLNAGADFRPIWRASLSTGAAPSTQASSEDRFDRARGNGAGANQARRVGGQIENRRGAPAEGRPAVENQADVHAQGVRHLLRRGRRRLPGSVRGGRDDGAPHGAGEARGDRMGRHAHSDRPSAADEPRGEIVPRREHESQRTGPEGLHQPSGGVRHLADAPLRAGAIGREERQRHPIGPPFRIEHPIDGVDAPGVAGQPVEGLGRVRHQEALADQIGGARQDRRVGVLRIDALHFRPHGARSPSVGGGVTIAQTAFRADIRTEPHP